MDKYYKALDTICELRKENMRLKADRWISVEDRLPEAEGEYLVATEFHGHKGRAVAYFRDEKWFRHETSHALLCVTHWQSLPALPEI